ncbi:MAG: phosphoglucosamine mutase [Planctomycetes bacterium]|nr:phosphoglucosamine mutase [Planctomycetota bacterium]
MKELKIGTSWVRGVVGDAFTPELAVNFACAFGTWGNGGAIAIGRDTRRSSPMIRAAVISGLLSAGCEVIDLGVCPTPVISFAVRELAAAGGLAITGSHNDARWNALKFIGPDGALLNAVKSEELLDIYHASAFLARPLHRSSRIVEAQEVVDRYLEHVLAALDAEAIRARGFRVAADFCNGSCYPILSRLLGELGCTLIPVNEKPSSQFAHAPSPSAANMRELAGLMGYLKADLGAAINIDGDRIAFAPADGPPLSEEYTLPLAAHSRLSRRPGPVVTNLSTSRMIEALAERFGQTVVRTMVGEGYVMDRGLEEGAVLAGEGNGGVGPLPAAMTFDAMLTLGLVLESMALTGSSPAEIVQQLPRYHMRKGELPCSPDQVYRVLEEFRAAFAGREPDLTDGVRVEWDDGWAHVRASNTEPLLRIIIEAETEARAEALFEDAMARGRQALHRQREA